MDKKLSLVFITYNKQIDVIRYVEKIIDFLPLNKIDVIIISDNKTDIKLSKKLLGKVQYYTNDNMGKLFSILTHVNKFETKYFKVIDDDDCLDYELVEKMVDNIREDDDFIYHNASIIYKDSEYFGLITAEKDQIKKLRIIGEDVTWKKIPNAQAIYNTGTIKLLSKIENLNYHKFFNDDIFTLACQFLATKIRKIDVAFYHQYHRRGQTAVITSEKFDSLLIMIKNLIVIASKFKMSFNGNYTQFKALVDSSLYQLRIINESTNKKPGTNKKILMKKLNELKSVIESKEKLTLLFIFDFENENIYSVVKKMISLIDKLNNDVLFIFKRNISNKIHEFLKLNGIRFIIINENYNNLILISNVIKYIDTEFVKIIVDKHLDKISNIDFMNLHVKKNKKYDIISYNNQTIIDSIKNDPICSKCTYYPLNENSSFLIDYLYSLLKNDYIYPTKHLLILQEVYDKFLNQDLYLDFLLINWLTASGVNLVKKKVPGKRYVLNNLTFKFDDLSIKDLRFIFHNLNVLKKNSNNFDVDKMYKNSLIDHVLFTIKLKNLQQDKSNFVNSQFKEIIKDLENIWKK